MRRLREKVYYKGGKISEVKISKRQFGSVIFKDGNKNRYLAVRRCQWEPWSIIFIAIATNFNKIRKTKKYRKYSFLKLSTWPHIKKETK
jgi:hypothetical protein